MRDIRWDSTHLTLQQIKDANPADRKILLVVAEETEKARKRMRERLGEHSKPLVPSYGLLGGEMPSISESTPWEDFLAEQETLDRCAKRLEVSGASLLYRVLAAVRVPNYKALLWFASYLEMRTLVGDLVMLAPNALEQSRGALAQVFGELAMPLPNALAAQAMKAQEAYLRMKQGGARGGARGAETRRRQSRLPHPALLRQEYSQLCTTRPRREVAGILAHKYGCTTAWIRKKLAQMV